MQNKNVVEPSLTNSEIEFVLRMLDVASQTEGYEPEGVEDDVREKLDDILHIRKGCLLSHGGRKCPVIENYTRREP